MKRTTQCGLAITLLLAPLTQALALSYTCADTTKSFAATGSLQSFTVPNGVTSITVDAAGAQGGNTVTGGKGAEVATTVAVTPNDVLCVVVGQKGQDGVFTTIGGAGGGGSFVYNSGAGGSCNAASEAAVTTTNLLVAAGGGGGGAFTNPPIGVSIVSGNPDATAPSGSGTGGASTGRDGAGAAGGGTGGTAGGGGGSTPASADGGGGLSTDGGAGVNTTGGKALKNGAAGGTASGATAASGGYGGGGGTALASGAGGGGYNGGGGGAVSTTAVGAGGGGGSFSAAALIASATKTGSQTGDGAVNLCYVTAPALHLAFNLQPTNVPRGTEINGVTVEVRNSANVVQTIDNTTQITLTVPACGGTVSIGPVIVVNGVATFTNVPPHFYTLATGLQLTAQSNPTYTPDTSQSFNVVDNSAELIFADGFETCRL